MKQHIIAISSELVQCLNIVVSHSLFNLENHKLEQPVCHFFLTLSYQESDYSSEREQVT